MPKREAAATGVFEISQACAVNTGCFPGDGGGFPVEITAPGSCRLTSNRIVPDANTSGIRVVGGDASDVYRENVINGNIGGTVTGGLEMQHNSCDGTASCP